MRRGLMQKAGPAMYDVKGPITNVAVWAGLNKQY